MVTHDQVMDALRQVQDPELGRDLVSLNMIGDVQVHGDGTVDVTVVLTTPACPLKDQIVHDVKAAVGALAGVKDVRVHMQSNVPHGLQAPIAPGIRNAIAIGSGKGGVGKSTVTANVAVALAEMGARVGILDADIYGPNIPTMLGIEKMPPPTPEGKLQPAEAYGVKVMSIGFFVPAGQPLIWRGPMLHTALRQFLTDVVWGEVDYLLVDLPPGTGDAPLSLAQLMSLSGAVIVTLPQKVSLEDASRALEMFRKLNVPILGVVENMSYLELPDGTRMDVFGHGGGEELARFAEVPFLGQIPIDPEVRKGGDAGKPVTIAHPESPTARAFRKVAEQIAAQVSVQVLQKEQAS